MIFGLVLRKFRMLEMPDVSIAIVQNSMLTLPYLKKLNGPEKRSFPHW